jgi:hypothetical protein
VSQNSSSGAVLHSLARPSRSVRRAASMMRASKGLCNSRAVFSRAHASGLRPVTGQQRVPWRTSYAYIN